AAVIPKYNPAVNAIFSDPEIAPRWENIGSDVEGGTPEQFDDLVKSEAQRLADLVGTLGIQLDGSGKVLTTETHRMSEKKFALVTGAGSGIGKSVALALMQDGFTVALAGRRTEALEETAHEGSKFGASSLVHSTDVGDPESVNQLYEHIAREFGRLDLLFNNAGIFTKPASIEDIPFEKWKA